MRYELLFGANKKRRKVKRLQIQVVFLALAMTCFNLPVLNANT